MPKPTDEKTWPYMFRDDMRFVQKAVVEHPDGVRFLAIKRSMAAHTRPGDWDLPGGSVLFGELHEESLRREIAEESSLTVGEIKVVSMFSSFDVKSEVYMLYCGFGCRATTHNVQLSVEHTEFRWVQLREFSDMCTGKHLVNIVENIYG